MSSIMTYKHIYVCRGIYHCRDIRTYLQYIPSINVYTYIYIERDMYVYIYVCLDVHL